MQFTWQGLLQTGVIKRYFFILCVCLPRKAYIKTYVCWFERRRESATKKKPLSLSKYFTIYTRTNKIAFLFNQGGPCRRGSGAVVEVRLSVLRGVSSRVVRGRRSGVPRVITRGTRACAAIACAQAQACRILCV